MNLFLIFAGGHCKQVIDIFSEYDNIIINGIFDDFIEKDFNYRGYKIIDTVDNIYKYINKDNDLLFCCIGDNDIRKKKIDNKRVYLLELILRLM